jgi:alkanesulfonate monooxygenase SsuD/methylene tetrahydromethanopterin reductase-like flavin-dependent oxidoreductase (luciferase family)
VKLGLFLDLRNPPAWRRPWVDHYAATLDLVAEAERLGADAVWVTEHHLFEDGYMPQPLAFLAAVAARTSRVRLGTAVLLAALRHPRHVAEEAAVVDLVSAGRLELGIGAGYRVPEYDAFGVDIGRRMTLTDRAMAEVRDLLWGGELLPPPAQERVPLWLGYQGPQGARRAGRLGVGLLTLDPALLDPYRAGLAEGGHDPASARMGGVIDLVVADDPAETARLIAPHYAYHFNSYRRYGVEGTTLPPPRERTPDELEARMIDPAATAGLVVRTVEDATDLIRARTAGVPVEHVYLWASIAGMPDHVVSRHIELAFGALRRRLATGAHDPR